MKKDLSSLLIKECCKGFSCAYCGFLKPDSSCYLVDIIKKLEESDNKIEGGNNNEK